VSKRRKLYHGNLKTLCMSKMLSEFNEKGHVLVKKVFKYDVKIGDSYIVDIMVSVLMTVYNHEHYLKKAIEGVLMQKTNFKYELIIGEDCSTDGSRKIVEFYQKKYPDIIRAMLNSKNLGMDSNGWQVTKAAKGKYLAICEGDDFWTDPNKLQIQVDFLERNPEYSGCYHSVKIIDEDENMIDIGSTPYIIQEDLDYGKEEWMKCKLPGQTGSVVMYNYYPKLKPADLELFLSTRCNGDNKIAILLLYHGKIRRMKRIMSCYRRTYTGDSWNARSRRRDMRGFYYVNSLERDNLAKTWLNFKFLSYDDSRCRLQSVLESSLTNRENSSKLLQEMALYDPYRFVAFFVANELQLLTKWEKPMIIELDSREYNSNYYVIFGTGLYGEKCFNFLDELGVRDKIVLFWDNDETKQGRKFHGISVEKPKASAEKNYRIIISSKKHHKAMKKQLIELGYSDEQIVGELYFVKNNLDIFINRFFKIE